MLVKRTWLAYIFALTGGFLLDVGTPGLDFWPAAWFGTALILASVWGRRPSSGLLLGLVSGATFWLPHISWLTLYLGPIPWLALTTVMVLWMSLQGAALAAVTRWIPDWKHSPVARLLLISLSVAGIWVARESIQSSWPYGGFPWGRLATTQATSPFADLASWLGFAGLSGVIVLLIALVLGFVRDSQVALNQRAKIARPSIGIAVTALVALLLTAVPIYTLEQTGSTRLGAVQGNADAGIFADRQPGDIMVDHLVASEQLVGENLDFFVWPENAADVDPTRSAAAARELDLITAEVGAPLVTGVITRENDRYFNSSIVWEPGGGVVDQYDKRRPVPFAEFMPHRSFYRALVPDLVDLVQLDYTAGDSSGVVRVAGVTAGIAICFDIIFDDLAVDMIDQGAEIVLAQSNNADFGTTDESVQQLAIARLRAIETGRTIVVISTVGTSAVVGPAGNDLDRLTAFTADTMVVDAPLYSGVTPAITWGWLLTLVFITIGVGGLVLAITLRSIRRVPPQAQPTPPDQNPENESAPEQYPSDQ